MLLALWKKRHFVLKFRGSLFRDHPSRKAWSAQAYRWPFRVERTIPQEGICKGKICNHDSKARWLLEVGRGETENTNTAAPGTEAWAIQASAGGLCTASWAGSLRCRTSWRHNGSSTLAKRVPGRLLRPGSPCCVLRKALRFCWQHFAYCWSMAISKGIFWYSREEKVRIFHVIWASMVMPSRLWAF